MGEMVAFTGIVLGLLSSIFGNVYVIAGAALVIAAIIIVVALMLFRNSGKKKQASPAASGSMDWQRQAQQQGGNGSWIHPDSAIPGELASAQVRHHHPHTSTPQHP